MNIQQFSFEGKNYRYSDQGSGQPLIFVGGAFQSIDRLGPLVDHWQQHYRLILIELPGFGLSDYLPPEYSFDFTAKCIKAIVDHLLLTKVIMVGTSYGSPSVYRYVGENQDNVTAMVLGGSCTGIDKFMEYQIRSLIWSVKTNSGVGFAKAFIEVMCNTNESSIPNAKRIHHILMRSLSRMNEADRNKFVANSKRLIGAKMPDYKIAVPTLVFTGEHDRFTPADRLSEFSEYCWDLQIVRLANADHMYHLEQTAGTLRLIDRFVASVEDNRALVAG